MRQTKRPNKAQPKAPPAPSPPEENAARDIPALRRSIVRKVVEVLDDWRTCPDRACRRHRTCASPRMVCLEQPSTRQISLKNQNEAIARLKRGLKRRSAEFGRERYGEGNK